jgi:hypothetical protein
MSIMKNRIALAVIPLFAILASPADSSVMEGRAWGDIHVQTIDGATYDFQTAGEFIASRSAAGDLEVQLRLESSGFSPHVSVATAAAVLVDSTRASVVLGRSPELYVDGRPAILPEGVLDLPDGGRIEASKKGYELYWSDGSVLSIEVRKRHLDAFLRPAETRRGTLSGLFGNFNGSPADDVDATLAVLGSGSRSELHPGLADLVRGLFDEDEKKQLLEQEESLFEYEPGQSTYSFRHPKPAREATPEALSANWRRRAERACEEAGVTDPDLLRACIIDVGYTHDESFAESAVAVQARDDANWDAQLSQRADAGF